MVWGPFYGSVRAAGIFPFPCYIPLYGSRAVHAGANFTSFIKFDFSNILTLLSCMFVYCSLLLFFLVKWLAAAELLLYAYSSEDLLNFTSPKRAQVQSHHPFGSSQGQSEHRGLHTATCTTLQHAAMTLRRRRRPRHPQHRRKRQSRNSARRMWIPLVVRQS